MRIISRYHDYYDKIVAFGPDEKYTFMREETGVCEGERLYRLPPELWNLTCGSSLGDRRSKEWQAGFAVFTVIIAGKAYGGVRVKLSSWGYVQTKEEFFYDVESFMKFMDDHGVTVGDLDIKHQRWKYRGYAPANRTIKEHLELNGSPLFVDYAIKQKAPIIVVREISENNVSVMLNSRLADLQFYKAMNPYTLWQEIDMFVSGILAPENRPMTKIDDKYKILEHGFDKWSFRKVPQS